MFHVKHCPSFTRVLTDNDLTVLLVRAMLRRHHIEAKFRSLYASVSFGGYARIAVSPTQSLSEKDSELLEARFGVLDAGPDDALYAE